MDFNLNVEYDDHHNSCGCFSCLNVQKWLGLALQRWGTWNSAFDKTKLNSRRTLIFFFDKKEKKIYESN